MRSTRRLPFFLYLAILLAASTVCQPAVADSRCIGTTNIFFSGNLDSASSLTTTPVAPTSFSELSSAASASVSIDIFDSLGFRHTVFLYFFHLSADSESSVWNVVAYLDGGELIGGISGTPVRATGGSAELTVGSSGQIVSPLPGVGLMTLTPSLGGWLNGANSTATFSLATEDLTFLSGSNSISFRVAPDSRCAQRQMDFDNDGIDDFVTVSPRTGRWVITRSSDQVQLKRTFGSSKDRFFVGDFTGDGLPDLARYQTDAARWFICSSASNYACDQATSTRLGNKGDIPAAADYDGDDILDRSVYRSKTGTLYYDESSSGQRKSKVVGKGLVVLNSEL